MIRHDEATHVGHNLGFNVVVFFHVQRIVDIQQQQHFFPSRAVFSVAVRSRGGGGGGGVRGSIRHAADRGEIGNSKEDGNTDECRRRRCPAPVEKESTTVGT